MKEGLSRFRQPHQADYPRALTEIRNGRKADHWIWYIFPQLKGLGYSSMSDYYGIRDLEEAKAYLADPVLGRDLVEICGALLSLDRDNPTEVMGWPDDLKLRSSMTLFDAAAEDTDIFQKVLDKYFQGRKDGRTLKMLGLEE